MAAPRLMVRGATTIGLAPAESSKGERPWTVNWA
jgi:hypothetical protein